MMGRPLAPVFGALVLLAMPELARAQGPQPSPEDFAATAAATDTFEITEAQFVLAQTRDEAVRAFAQEMLADHARTRQALEAAAAKSGLRAPRSMDADQARLLSGLQGETGSAMDRDYLTQQVITHTAALAVQSAYARQGSDPNLRLAADAAAPVVKHHLDMARALSGKTAP